jgi:DNA repair exonuclease SbcCD ATPase subunit
MPSSKKKGSGKKASASNKATSDAINAKIEALAAGASASQPLPNVDTLATAGAAAIRKVLLAPKNDADAAAEGDTSRLEAVQQEYRRLADAAKRVEADRKTQVARAADRDRIASELTRTREVKERLEVLCRELQKQSKDVTEGAQQQRDALNAQFQSSIEDIQKRLEEQATVQLDNQTLRKKLELIEKQSEIREQQYAAETRHKELEMELCTTQLAQATAQVRAASPTPPRVAPGSRCCRARACNLPTALQFQASEADRKAMAKNELELREQVSIHQLVGCAA